MLSLLPRTTTREWYYANRVALGRYYNQLEDPLVNKAKIIARINKASINGMVKFYQAGTDCDGFRYCFERVRPAAFVYYMQLQAEAAMWADGPYIIGIKHETHA